MQLRDTFISDLEKAIATRSGETGAMLHQITDLFLLHAGHYSVDQVELYDDVLQKLVAKVDVAARTTLAQRLAPVDDAPGNTVRALAFDNAIEVAGPILLQSNALDDNALVDCIASKGQGHLFAIANRNRISENVSDRLVERGGRQVLGALVNNFGATISDRGYGWLVEKSAGDDDLSEAIARRNDIPPHHFRELVSKASDIVRKRLIENTPELKEMITEVLSGNSTAPNDQQQPPRDYRTAELVVNSRPLTEATVYEFATARQIDEVVVAIARMCGLSTKEIARVFLGPWSSPVAVVLKAIGFRMATMDAIYRARLPQGDPVHDDLARTKAEFIAVSRSTADRIMRFYRTRKSVEFGGQPLAKS